MTDEITRVQQKLANPEFVKKAKPAVIDKEREKANQYEDKIKALRGSLQKLEEIQIERN